LKEYEISGKNRPKVHKYFKSDHYDIIKSDLLDKIEIHEMFSNKDHEICPKTHRVATWDENHQLADVFHVNIKTKEKKIVQTNKI
jgi:hypothetical protein